MRCIINKCHNLFFASMGEFDNEQCSPCSIRANTQTRIFRFDVIFGAPNTEHRSLFVVGSGANGFQCWDVQKLYPNRRAGIRANLKSFRAGYRAESVTPSRALTRPCRRAAFRAVFHFGAIFSPRATTNDQRSGPSSIGTRTF